MTLALTLPRPLEGIWSHSAGLRLRAVRLWRAYPRETVGIGVLTATLALALAGAAHSRPDLAGESGLAPPAPPPMVLRQVAPDQALALNQQIPLAGGPNPAARPFVFSGNAASRSRALECLASAVYYEAGSQDEDGARAVAQVVLNRVRHPAFPASVCDVVYQGSTRPTGCQFTFTCDGSLYRQPDSAGWRRSYRIAQEALAGRVYAPVGYATHYHANYVVPYWASTLSKNAVVGAHIFYRWAGGWGRPMAFGKGYAGREPNARALRDAAVAAEAVVGNGTPASEMAEAIIEIPGAQALPLAPSMRGDKRVAIRFNLAGRKAAETAPHSNYVEKFEASDNLRWSLSNEQVASDEKPLGQSSERSSGDGAAIATAER